MFKFFKKIFSFFKFNPEIKQVVELIGARRIGIKVARKKGVKTINEMIQYCNMLLNMNGSLQNFYELTVHGIIKEIGDDPLLKADLKTILGLVTVHGSVDTIKFRNFITGFKEGLIYGKA